MQPPAGGCPRRCRPRARPRRGPVAAPEESWRRSRPRPPVGTGAPTPRALPRIGRQPGLDAVQRPPLVPEVSREPQRPPDHEQDQTPEAPGHDVRNLLGHELRAAGAHPPEHEREDAPGECPHREHPVPLEAAPSQEFHVHLSFFRTRYARLEARTTTAARTTMGYRVRLDTVMGSRRTTVRGWAAGAATGAGTDGAAAEVAGRASPPSAGGAVVTGTEAPPSCGGPAGSEAAAGGGTADPLAMAKARPTVMLTWAG